MAPQRALWCDLRCEADLEFASSGGAPTRHSLLGMGQATVCSGLAPPKCRGSALEQAKREEQRQRREAREAGYRQRLGLPAVAAAVHAADGQVEVQGKRGPSTAFGTPIQPLLLPSGE